MDGKESSKNKGASDPLTLGVLVVLIMAGIVACSEAPEKDGGTRAELASSVRADYARGVAADKAADGSARAILEVKGIDGDPLAFGKTFGVTQNSVRAGCGHVGRMINADRGTTSAMSRYVVLIDSKRVAEDGSVGFRALWRKFCSHPRVNGLLNPPLEFAGKQFGTTRTKDMQIEDAAGREWISRNAPTELLGVKIDHVGYMYIHTKLDAVDVRARGRDTYGRLLDELTIKYGVPTRDQSNEGIVWWEWGRGRPEIGLSYTEDGDLVDVNVTDDGIG